jgi:hypothetical protein
LASKCLGRPCCVFMPLCNHRHERPMASTLCFNSVY